MIVENRNMDSLEEEALLGEESEDENSELSDNEVSATVVMLTVANTSQEENASMLLKLF